MNSKPALVTLAAMVILLMSSVSGLIENDEPKTRAGPDLEVTDIWQGGPWMLGCTVVNNGEPYAGDVRINLSINGEYSMSTVRDWLGDGSHQNFTFEYGENYINGEMTIEIRVYLLDGEEFNTGNNYRWESWNLVAPDLYIESIYPHPETNDMTVCIRNFEIVDVTDPFVISYYVNDIFEKNVFYDGGVEGGSSITVSLNWTWDPESLISVSAWVDAWSEIVETNENNNYQWNDLFTAGAGPYFTYGPIIVNVGSNNATITWNASEPLTWFVMYGTGARLRKRSPTFGPASNGTYELPDLLPGCLYSYRLWCLGDSYYGSLFHEGIFHTLQGPTFDPPQGEFPGGDTFTYTPEFDIPVNIFDPDGMDDIGIYVDGNYMGSAYGLGANSTDGLNFYLGPYLSGNHSIKLVVRDTGGNTRVINGTFRWKEPGSPDYPLILSRNMDLVYYSGTRLMNIIVEDPGGIENVTWMLDGDPIYVDEPEGEVSTYSSEYWWDTSLSANGDHTITVQVNTVSGGLSEIACDVFVNNLFEVGDPSLEISRGPLTNTGTRATVSFEITNTGPQTARNVHLTDIIKGFVPMVQGASSINEEATIWSVTRNLASIPGGSTVTVTYDCIPIIAMTEQWEVGHPMMVPGDPGELYTTILTWESTDSSFVSYELLSGGFFEGGINIQQGVHDALDSSNYLMVTNPSRLRERMLPGPRCDDLIIKAGELLSLRNGVFGFIEKDPDEYYTARYVLDEIVRIKDHLYPLYDQYGYLAILGENDVIPSWSYGQGERRITGSDHGYSNLGGGDEPEVIVGRFIGDSVDEMMPQLNTSIGLASGILENEHDGTALLISGGHDGIESFFENTEDLREYLEPRMNEVNTHHISDVFEIGSMEVGVVVKDEKVASGDLDGDGTDEVMILDTVNDTILIAHPDEGILETEDIGSVSPYAKVLSGQFDDDEDHEIAIIDEPTGGMLPAGSIRVFDHTFSLVFSNWLPYKGRNGVCVLDHDGDGDEEIAFADHEVDRIIVSEPNGTILDTISVDRVDTDSRLEWGDYDLDGKGDLIVILPGNVGSYCVKGDDWTQVSINSRLYENDAVCTGEINLLKGDQLLLAYSDNSNNYICSKFIRWNNERGSYCFYTVNDPIFTYASGPSALVCSEVLENGDVQEIILLESGKLRILDFSNISSRLRDMVTPYLDEADLVFYRDHGLSSSWGHFLRSSHMEERNFFDSVHRPVVFSSACSTGAFDKSQNSFAEAWMANGAGLFIGATETSYRNLNNMASQILKYYAEGYPIGTSMRSIEREFIRLGHHSWVYKYNIFGDPAFGTDGGPIFFDPGINYYDVPTRGGSLSVEIADVEFLDMGEGLRAVIPGERYTAELGGPFIPYATYEIDTGLEVASSVDVVNLTTWRYFEGLFLGNGSMTLTDGRNILNASNVSMLDDWSPAASFNWSTGKLPNGNNSIVLRIYPFRYNSRMAMGMFCGNWSIDVETVPDTVDIVGVEGPPVLMYDEKGKFTFTLEPTGPVSVSVSNWIEGPDGEVYEVLNTRVIDINSTSTVFDEFTPTYPDDGEFVFKTAVYDLQGNEIETGQFKFTVGIPGVHLRLNASKTEFNEGDMIPVKLEVESGDIHYRYNVTVMDEGLNPVAYYFTDHSFHGSRTIDIDIDMTGLTGDLYVIMARLEYNGGLDFTGKTAYDSVMVYREGSVPEPEIGPVMSIEAVLSSSNATEGDMIWVNGTISLGSGWSEEGIPVTAFMGNMTISNTTRTGVGGTFSIMLPCPYKGDFTVEVLALKGSLSERISIPITVNEKETDGNDTDTDTDSDTDTDNDTDTDADTDTDTDTDGDKDNEKHSWVWFLIPILLLLLIGAVILFIMSRKKEEVLGWDDEE